MSIDDVTVMFQLVVLTAATITALVIIGRALRGVYRFVKRMDVIHSTILSELLPNGGSSIKDQISRIDARVAALEAKAACDCPHP